MGILITAEIGINHNGDINIAKDLIKKFGDLSGVLSADRDYCLRSKASLKMSLKN